MSGYTDSGSSAASPRQLQWPFIGVVVLLVVLILLTPDLFSSGGSSLSTSAQLIVDHSITSGNTSFYVESIGTSTRYQSISLGLARLLSWPFRGTTSDVVRWNWTNATNMLVLVVTNQTNPVAVNVTVRYTDPSGITTEYVGVYGFELNATTQVLEAVGLLPGASPPPASTPWADLPIFLGLVIKTPSGSP